MYQTKQKCIYANNPFHSCWKNDFLDCACEKITISNMYASPPLLVSWLGPLIENDNAVKKGNPGFKLEISFKATMLDRGKS